MEFQHHVYLLLNLENITARKLYNLSKIKQCSIIELAEKIVEGYLSDIQIDPWIAGELKYPDIQQENPRKRIGLKIACYRKINCFTQRRFGEIINLDQRSVSQIESGTRRLDIVEAIAIAQVLGVELSEII